MRLADLRLHNRRAIAAAGPRYAPGLDASAPNLAIASLDRAFETAGVTAAFRAEVSRVRATFQKAWHDAPRQVREHFATRVQNPARLLAHLADLEAARPAEAGGVRHRATITASRLDTVAEHLAEQALEALRNAPADSEERRARDVEYGEARRFTFAVRAVLDFLRSPSAALLEKNVLLLLGGWGMGKTHSLCDLTKRRMEQGFPTLFCLAQQLPDSVNPLEALCQTTGLARHGAELLAALDRMGRQRRTRSMLIIDAIAEQLRDYVTWDECIAAIEPVLQGRPRPRQIARQVARRMVVDGLLTEELRWDADEQREVVRFPYQRFADHIVARSLLQHLNTTSAVTIRRSFYRNRPLGRVFDVAPGQLSYLRPGFASAVMLEFPERVTGHVPADETELVSYLPRNRQLVAPFKEAFLEGLPWRSADHFTQQTQNLIAALLDRHNAETRNETLEVLFGLATRPGHPCSAAKLHRYVRRMSMANRDLIWTEFIRTAGDTSSALKLVEWVERNANKTFHRDAVEITTTLLALLLTSIHRPFRDRVTRALFLLGLKHPEALFTQSRARSERRDNTGYD
jgi:hypothetical protein